MAKAKKTAKKKTLTRSEIAKKAWRTRRKNAKALAVQPAYPLG